MSEKKILLTGVTGFIGQSVWGELISRGVIVSCAVRTRDSVMLVDPAINCLVLGDFGAQTDWAKALSGVDCIIHCAARSQVSHEPEVVALGIYRAVNVEGTLRLAEQAAAAGVRRFVFLSSIKVNGENTNGFRRFSSDDVPCPKEPYGVSKCEAEQGLREIAAKTDLEVVIIRSPLVYGPGVKGNFRSMLDWLNRSIPLPLATILNKRSLVGIDNLVDLIIACIDRKAAANHTFLVSDDEDLSTSELLHRMGVALGKPARLFPVPAFLLQFSARLIGKKYMVERLLGNLQVDIYKTKEVLDWVPPYTVNEGLRKTAERYLGQ
ncbi:SDR family oxidoreductase [Litorivicinus sp.]|nr:SDR family oxidoreductase [Litorivicinus sp.]MDC1240005.1 SDR family oxidoreductase [Litorivicinus sp.]